MATITQWKILKVLTKKRQGTQEIRAKLMQDGVDLTLRSVQRNLEKLSEAFPIYSDHNNPAGWAWMEDAELFDLPVMDANAALTLRLSEEYLSAMMPKSCLNMIHPYMLRARNLLEETDGHGVGDWANRVARLSRTQHLIPPEVKGDVLDSVYQAVLEKRQLRMFYRRVGSETAEERLIHPHALVFVDGVVYLVGTVWDYEDLRQFALHRIESAEMLEGPAGLNADFNLKEYIAAGHFDFPISGEPIKVRLLVDDWLAAFLAESRLSVDQKITPEEDEYLVEATVLNTAQLKWWLLGLGDQVEVLAPASIRKSMKTTIAAMNSFYDDEC